MADALYELLFDNAESPPSPRDSQTTSYLSRISTLSLVDLTSNEPASLLHTTQSHLRNIQALSKRSHKAVIASSSHLANLSSLLPAFNSNARSLSNQIPELESSASDFAKRYDRNTENAVLDRRKQTVLLSRNVDRVSEVLDLPSLLSSVVTAAQAGNVGLSTPAGSTTSYASALDLNSHIKRLRALYPQSDLVGSISTQSDIEMQNLAVILITSLQSATLKLAAAMRTIGLLRRVAPELAEDGHHMLKSGMLSTKSLSLSPNALSHDGALGSLFLTCRLKTFHETLEALDPLRDLADQETAQRQDRSSGSTSKQTPSSVSALGSQSERYLKRYIEIFREQSFGILSMYKSIFTSNLPEPEHSHNSDEMPKVAHDPLLPLPSAVSSFALHLVEMLESTLKEYMPNISDKSARDSLLTQVLYCAGSLGRLGADFGMMVALLEDDVVAEEGISEDTNKRAHAEPEWVQVMNKHRVQAGRLEVLARGVGTQRKTSTEILPPSATSPSSSPQPV